MVDEIKLPGSSFEELNKIIQGYAMLDKPSSLGAVSKQIGMANETISRNTGFLVALGILEGRRDKSSTSLGKELGNALMHSLEEEIRRHYSSAVSESEFLKSVTNAIRIRKGMDEGALKSHIAYSAGAKKNASTTTGSGAVIEILKVAGAIKEEDGKYIVASEPLRSHSWSGSSSDVVAESTFTRAPQVEQKFYGGGSLQSTAVRSAVNETDVQIKININISCEPADLEGLGQRLRGVLDSLKDQDVEVDGQVEHERNQLQD